MATTLIHPNLQKLLDRTKQFFAEVEDLTPGRELETRLNAEYGPGTTIYDDFATLIQQGVKNNEGWVAVDETDGPKYRRTKISLPAAET